MVQAGKQAGVQAEVTFTDRAIGRTDILTDRRTQGTRRLEQGVRNGREREGNNELTHDASQKRPISLSGNCSATCCRVRDALARSPGAKWGGTLASLASSPATSLIRYTRTRDLAREGRGGGGRAARSNLPPFLRSRSERAGEREGG